MTPLSSTPAATAQTAPTARPHTHAHVQKADMRPTFEAVRQDVEATHPKPKKQNEADLADSAVSDATLSAPATPPEPIAMPLIQLSALANTDATLATLPKAISTAALAASSGPAIFFQDAENASPDAADFAADLLAALTNTSNTAGGIADAKALATAEPKTVVADLPQLDMTSDAWLDQLARDITATASADGKLSFRIVPPQLGKLDINIETRDAGVAVHMKAETREAQAIITAAQPRLENALGQQGIRVAETSVASNGQENLPKSHFIPQKPLIEAVNDSEPEADTPTLGRAAGRFA